MALPPKPKRGRGRPKKIDAVYHAAQSKKVDIFEDIDVMLPEIFNRLKRMSMDDNHRQQLTAIKSLLDYHAKFLEKLEQEEEAALAAEQEAQQSQQQGFSSGPSVSFEYEETGSSSSLQ